MSTKRLAPCGTEAAYRRHLRWKETPCASCRAEHARLQAVHRAAPRKPPRQLVPCGNVAAYRRHLRWGEQPCRACMDANAAEMRAWTRRRAA